MRQLEPTETKWGWRYRLINLLFRGKLSLRFGFDRQAMGVAMTDLQGNVVSWALITHEDFDLMLQGMLDVQARRRLIE